MQMEKLVVPFPIVVDGREDVSACRIEYDKPHLLQALERYDRAIYSKIDSMPYLYPFDPHSFRLGAALGHHLLLSSAIHHRVSLPATFKALNENRVPVTLKEIAEADRDLGPVLGSRGKSLVEVMEQVFSGNHREAAFGGALLAVDMKLAAYYAHQRFILERAARSKASAVPVSIEADKSA